MPEGDYVVTIKSAAEALSKKSDDYKDRTPQIELKFEDKKGFISHWFNLKGFKKDETTGQYETDKKGNRVEDAENTAAALSIFERVAIHAGLTSGESFTMEDLIGLKIGIAVRKNDRGIARVKYTMPASKVGAVALKATEESAD